jgi:hypothetical protein
VRNSEGPLMHRSTCMHMSVIMFLLLKHMINIYISFYLSIYIYLYPSTHLSIHLSISTFTNLPVYPSIHRSIDLSIYRPIYLFIYLDVQRYSMPSTQYPRQKLEQLPKPMKSFRESWTPWCPLEIITTKKP